MVNLSVIIPTYLEEENLRLLLPRIIDTLKKLSITYEIIIVDTKEQMDRTKDLCNQYDLIVYKNREGENNTYGDAIRTGIKCAKGEHSLLMDADGSHSPEFIEDLYSFINNFDVVIASRYVDGGCTDNSKVLIWMSKILNQIYSIVLGINCKDISNSFKLYKTSHLQSIKLSCDNFDIVEEILYKLVKKYNIKIKELPYLFKKRMFGETKRNLFLFILTYLFTLIKLRFGK